MQPKYDRMMSESIMIDHDVPQLNTDLSYKQQIKKPAELYGFNWSHYGRST